MNKERKIISYQQRPTVDDHLGKMNVEDAPEAVRNKVQALVDKCRRVYFFFFYRDLCTVA